MEVVGCLSMLIEWQLYGLSVWSAMPLQPKLKGFCDKYV